MHKLFFGFLLFITSTSFSQDSLESFSYYFKTIECNAFTNILGLENTKYVGSYKLVETKFNQMRVTAGDDLIVDEHGVYIAKNKLLSISRQTVREDSKYRVKNGYLHGLIKNDSLPTFLQDSAYYFLLPTKAFLFDTSTKNQKLYQINNSTFLVLTYEKDNKAYSALQIKFKGKQIALSELDLSYALTSSLTHHIITQYDIKTFILNPSKKEWETIINNFVVYDRYILKR